jgi:glycosyltransferase involved in cell wall biosynthesis
VAVRRMGEEGREHVRASYSWAAHLRRLEELYTSVLDS